MTRGFDKDVLHIIQDHECVTQFLDALCCSIENSTVGVPNFVPMTYDALLHEQLCMLAEFVARNKSGK